jgi:hypothetical protein
MDANTPEIIVVGAPNTALNAAITLIQLPLLESINIVEFGIYNAAGADNVASGVLKLQAVDTTAGGATFTDLCILTGTASAPAQGGVIARLCDVLVDKVNNVAVGPGSTGNTNAAISPSAGKQFIAVQLRITTGFTAATVGCGFIKYRKQGSGSTAVTGETLVIA